MTLQGNLLGGLSQVPCQWLMTTLSQCAHSSGVLSRESTHEDPTKETSQIPSMTPAQTHTDHAQRALEAVTRTNTSPSTCPATTSHQ